MIFPFYKFHGTGNDFIIIDNRSNLIHKYTDNQKLIKYLCDRHFGIGADGLILLNNKVSFDFEMLYYNSDGNKGSMCGNGGRCVVAFANMLNIVRGNARFSAGGNTYTARIERKKDSVIHVSLQMQNVVGFTENKNSFLIDTGSPHYICFTDNIEEKDVFKEGSQIRYSSVFKEKGVNVNFVEAGDKGLYVRTYERGVENETLSCGTGAVASAMAYYLKNPTLKTMPIPIHTKGGLLKVSFVYTDTIFKNVFLHGPATFVYKGEISV